MHYFVCCLGFFFTCFHVAGVDDFYVTSQKLAVIETTNSVFNTSLYDAITPKSVPYWVRVTVANRMASTAAEWHNVFYRHNSGTYNNQWMTFDYKAFTPVSQTAVLF